MGDFIRATIHFVLANYPLTFLVIGLLVSAAAIARQHRPWARADIVEASPVRRCCACSAWSTHATEGRWST